MGNMIDNHDFLYYKMNINKKCISITLPYIFYFRHFGSALLKFTGCLKSQS